MDIGPVLISIVDTLAPGLHWLAVSISVIGIPTLLWINRGRIAWKTERREDRRDAAELMGKLLDQQRAELTRHIAEGESLRRQVELFIEGRWQLQQALDTMREQVIAARVLIHDYQRQLGLPETQFPPTPSLAVIPRAA